MSVCVWIKEKRGRSSVSPEEFLTWAEKDFNGGGRRERANALTNSKRALHARIDEILYSLRVKYAKNWPEEPNIGTKLKLKVLKSLNIKTTAIVRILTERRNDLEHAYVLPSSNEVEAAVETARLWLNDPKSYLHPSIALAGLTIKPSRKFVDHRIRKEKLLVEFGPKEQVFFFCDARRKLIISNSDGTQSEKSYKELGWKDLIQYQKPYLSEDNKLIVSSLSIATKIYMKYEEWLRNKSKMIVKDGFGIVLKINEVLKESNPH